MRHELPGFTEDEAQDTLTCEVCGQRFSFSEHARANPTRTPEDVEEILTWSLADHRCHCYILE